MNSSSEIAQKFCSLQVTFMCEQEINILVKIIRSLSQGHETTYTLTEWTCIEMTLFSYFVLKGCPPVTLNPLYFASKCPFLELCGINSISFLVLKNLHLQTVNKKLILIPAKFCLPILFQEFEKVKCVLNKNVLWARKMLVYISRTIFPIWHKFTFILKLHVYCYVPML